MVKLSPVVSNPPSPISCGNVQTEVEGIISAIPASPAALRIFEAALKEAVPQEALSDTGGIGFSRIVKLWRPNNYRRQISTRRVADTGSISSAGGYRDFKVTKKKVLILSDYPNVVLMHFRDMTIAIWSQNIVEGEKETFLLESDSWTGIERRISEKREEIRSRLDAALADFCDRMRCGVPGAVPVWEASEDWTKTEDWKGKLPASCIVYEECFKKVYRDGVEFTTRRGEEPGQRMLQFHRNMATMELSPEICAEMFALRREVVALRKDFGNIRFIAVGDGKAPAAKGQRKLGEWSE